MGHKDDSVLVEMEVSAQEVRSSETMIKGILAAVFYGFCSVSSAFVTKSLMDTLDFDFPVTIMVSQMIYTIIVLEALACLNVITLPAYTLKRGYSFLAPSLFYGANSVLALTALSHMNIAMYGVLKRCVPLSTMLLSSVILKKGWPSKWTMMTVCMLSIGCVIAGYGDLMFSVVAYSCGIASNFTQALYLLLVQRFAQHQKLSTFETLQLNCFNALPIMAVAAFLNGEMATVWSYPFAEHPYFFLVFLSTISVGMLLNYSLFLCTGLTSALTTSVVGGLKAMVQTMLGLVTFGGVSHNLPTYLGITLNLVGGTGYIFVKYKENNKNLHRGIHKVMSFSNMISSRGSSLFDGGASTANGLMPPVSEDSSGESRLKERSYSTSHE
ncbi:LOW QUALITY PROTEIN: uncharacterized protein LOC143290922 [Babylonia areolata]|uniref:LOW QUALITY PROTEIN: uncharacterized protein LOC143290922 n=1 Tax=Babylonia areolata TaxID=304850 RepID=UPI003FD1BA0A